MSAIARASLVLLAVAAGCGSQAGSGTLVVGATGEEAAVDGYPSRTGVGFVDGWTMQWDFVLVSVDAFYVAHEGYRTALEADPVVVNLHDAVLEDVWSFPALTAQRWEDVGYDIVPPASASVQRIGTVTDAQIATMTDEHVSFWLHGAAHHATHGDFTLDLRVPLRIHQSACTSGADMTDGVVVTPNGTTNAQVTFHLDHVFFDSIVATAPALRFQAYAAAAGMDRVVTLEDLATQPIADLHDIDGTPLTEGGIAVTYDAGSAALVSPDGTGAADQTLRGFVYRQATTVGHFDGEGHCQYEVLR